MQNMLFFFRFSEYLQATSLSFYAQHSENFFFLIILHIIYVQKFLSGIRIPDMLQLETSFRTQQKGGYPQ